MTNYGDYGSHNDCRLSVYVIFHTSCCIAKRGFSHWHISGRQGEKHQEANSKFYEQDPEESTSGHTKEQSSHDYWNSEAGRFKQQFWNQTWWAFGGSGDAYWKAKATKCNQSAHSGSFGGAHWQSGETAGRCSADSGWVSESVGAASDRVALGLSPVGPLTLNDVKLA